MNHFLTKGTVALIFFMFTVHIVRAGELSTPRIMLNPLGHTGKINDIHYAPSGRELVTVSDDKSIRVWDVKSGKMLHLYYPEIGDGLQGMIYTSALSPDGKLMAFSGYPVGDGTRNYILIINLENGKETCRATGHGNVVNTMDFSYDGKYLASGDDDGAVIIWKVAADSALAKAGELNFGNRISALSFAPDNMNLAIASDDKDARIYDVANPSESKKEYPYTNLRRNTDPLKYITFSPDGKYLASSDEGDKVVLWNKNGDFIQEISGFQHSVNALSFSEDGKILVAMNDVDGAGESYAIPECNHLTSFHGHDNTVMAVDFSPQSVNGNYQVASAGGNDNEVIIWNAINGRVIKRIKGLGTSIPNVGFSEGLEVYFDRSSDSGGQKASKIQHFDFNGFQLKTDTGSNQAAQGKPAKKGNLVQAGFYDIKLHNGAVLHNDPAVDGRILDCVSTKNGQVIVSSDFSLKMYDQHLNILKEFVGHTGAVRSVDISADGRYLVSGGDDQTIRLWDLKEKGKLPSIKDVYKDAAYQQFFTAYGLDSVASVHDRKAWTATIGFLQESKDKAYKDFENTLAQLGETISPFMTLFVADNNQWICYTNSGYFTCSSKGGDYFIWQINRGPTAWPNISMHHNILISFSALTC